MPIWSNEVPDDPRGPSLPVRRTPAHGQLIAIATSEDLIGCYTHYFKSRTCPCEGNDCEACREGIPYRWHAYLAAEEARTGLHFIFECTAQAAEHFTEYRKLHGTLRGCLFEARRWNNRPNARICLKVATANLTERRLAKPPDLQRCLEILWNLTPRDAAGHRRNPEKHTTQFPNDPKPEKPR